MKVGLVGFRGSGKSTVFNVLMGVKARRLRKARKPRVGTLAVPDPRLEKLGEILKVKNIRHAEVSLVDFNPGKGARVLNPGSFKQLTEADALALVVSHFAGALQQSRRSPAAAVEDFESELKLTDLVAVDKWLAQLKKAKASQRELDLMMRCKAFLESEGPLRNLTLDKEEKSWVAGFRFLSEKPLMIVVNVGQDQAVRPMPKDLVRYSKKQGIPMVPIYAKAEMDLAGVDELERTKRFKELGLKELASQRFIRAYFDRLMNLTMVLAYNQDWVWAWGVKRGTTALQAAMELHSGSSHEVLGLELIRYEDLVKYGDENRARQAGKFKTPAEGYRVRDGDILLPRLSEGGVD